jgi:STE24 endopeptidase
MRRSIIFAAIFTGLAGLACSALAAPFDPEIAARGYLDTLKGAERARSDAYFEGGYWLLLWGTVIAVGAELAMLHFGWSAAFRDWSQKVVKWRWFQPALYALPYGLVSALIILPWTICTEFFREKSYGLMNLGFGEWAAELVITVVINVILMAIFLAVIFAVIRRSPRFWWLWGAGATSAMLAIFVMIVPVFISPLFNDFTELKAGPVRDRIVAMAESQKVPAEHIYVFDQSKQHDRISANVSGLGPTIRISLNDNLLNRTGLPETAAVMAHEIGHYKLGHLPWRIAAFSVLALFVFWVSSRLAPILLARFGSAWKVRDLSDVAAFPVLAVIFAVVQLAITPITNSVIRIQESQADVFGLELAREPDGFASAAMRLSQYRKIEPGPIEEMLFFTHPSGATRVRMAMEWKAKNLAEIEARAPASGAPKP